MQFRIYNTLTRKIEEFRPLKPNHVGIYMCGMTVQDRPHLGHIRTFLVGDILRRYLEYLGFEVTYVQNFTDIDDKIIKKAQEENIDWRSLGQKYVDKYLKSAEKLNI
ncbi:MAG TPA: cysteine--tRNA ligase, partial [candidate division WOR-3 bacterium]|nr:cysteine--tRNA ligase [candidate division WOR-3 bacterium]